MSFFKTHIVTEVDFILEGESLMSGWDCGMCPVARII